ncbi:MAG: PAS domain S-box protein [Desulfobacula sp.]|nr:PAS domain S-box protein [Desulfobacula sp.]
MIPKQNKEKKLFDHGLKDKAFFDENPLPSIIFDRETLAIVDVNNAAVGHYGYSREEFLSMTIKELRPPEEIQAMMKGIAMDASDVRKVPFFRHKKKDGTPIDVMASARDFDAGGRSYRFVTFTDITQRRKAGTAVLKNGEMYRKLMKAIPDIVVRTDVEGHISFINEESPLYLKYFSPETDPTGKNFLSFIAPYDRARAMNNYIRMLREPVGIETYDIILEDGRTVPCEVNGTVVFDNEGHPTEMVFIIRDTTEKKKTEEALVKSEKKFRMMADLLPQTIFETDLTGRLTYVNKTAYENFGYSPEEFGNGLNVFSMIAPEDRPVASKNIQDVLAGRPMRGNAYRALKKDGSVFPVMIYSSPMEEEGNPVGLRGILIDLTDIRRAEDEKVINESKFRAIYDQASHLAGIVSKEGVLLETNRVAREFIGKDKSVFIGKLFWETPWWEHSREAQQLLKSGFERALQGEFVRFETTHMNHENELRRIDFSIKPVLDSQGKVFCLIPESLDITEQRQTEEALRRSEETFRALAENSADTIMRFDRFGRHLYVNPAVEQETGIEKKVFLGKTHEELGFPPDLCRQGHEAIQKVFDTGEKHRIEFRLPNGSWVDWLLMPEFGTGREVKAVITSGRDITERKQAESILHLVQYGVNHSRDSIFWLDSETRLVYVNDAACRSLGYSREELLSMTISDIDPDFPPEAWPPQLEKLRKYGSVTHESRHRTRDGRIFPVEVTGNYVCFEGNEGSFAFARNITDRKQAEAEREKLQEQLIQAQKMDSIGRLAGGVAHDFNNMLGAIIGYVELGLINSSDNPEMHSYLKQIQAAALRSADLTRQLLAFARKQPISPKALDLNVTAAGMLKMIQRLIGEDIELDFQPAKGLWQVNLDPSQLDQILMNLCVNARDAISGIGRMSIRTGNESFTENDLLNIPGSIPGDYVMVEVADNGCGMSEDTLSNLFEPFFTTKEVGKGTGLGLATVYGIVQQNRGFIKVESTLSCGTRFKIYLPRHRGSLSDTDNKEIEVTAGKGHETILLVEDEPILLDMTKEMLELNGYQVLIALNPDEALQIAGDHADEIHLVMTDVVMPGMNGYDLAEKLMSLYPGLKCLFMSGYTASVIARHGVLGEPVHFIQKPFSMNDLIAKVRHVLDTEDAFDKKE